MMFVVSLNISPSATSIASLRGYSLAGDQTGTSVKLGKLPSLYIVVSFVVTEVLFVSTTTLLLARKVNLPPL